MSFRELSLIFIIVGKFISSISSYFSFFKFSLNFHFCLIISKFYGTSEFRGLIFIYMIDIFILFLDSPWNKNSIFEDPIKDYLFIFYELSFPLKLTLRQLPFVCVFLTIHMSLF